MKETDLKHQEQHCPYLDYEQYGNQILQVTNTNVQVWNFEPQQKSDTLKICMVCDNGKVATDKIVMKMPYSPFNGERFLMYSWSAQFSSIK